MVRKARVGGWPLQTATGQGIGLPERNHRRVLTSADPDGNVLDAKGPYARLLAQPNSEMSPYSFWRWTYNLVLTVAGPQRDLRNI
jgi:hypothetical protein